MSTTSGQPAHPRSSSGATSAADLEGAGQDRPSALSRVGAVLTSIFVPILPPLIGAGILQGLLSVLTGFGLLSTTSTEYLVLSTISTAVFFFLPFLLAVSSAKAFETNPFAAIGITALLLHPDTTALLQRPGGVDFLGIPIVETTYTSSVLPAILVVYVMGHLGRLFRRLLPPVLHTILVPTLVMLLGGVLSLLLLGPLGNLVGLGLGAAVGWLSGIAGWLVPTVIGATGALLISVGASFTLFPVAIQQVVDQGFNTVYGPGMLAVNYGLTGMSLAVMQKSRRKEFKAYSASAALTAALGVAQPALYGLAIPLRRPLVATCLGGLVGGLIGGLTGFKVYGMVPSGLAALPAFVGTDGLANVVKGVVVMLSALVTSYVATRLLGFDEPGPKTVAEMTDEDQVLEDKDDTDEDQVLDDQTAADEPPRGSPRTASTR